MPPGPALGKRSEAEKGINFEDDKKRGKPVGDGEKDRIAWGQKKVEKGRGKKYLLFESSMYLFPDFQ